MPRKKTVVNVCSQSEESAEPFVAKPLYEVSPTVDVEDGADIYLVTENVRYQLRKQISPFFGGEEFVFRGKIDKGSEICFVHKDGRKIPVHGASDCGYTLVGKARRYFEARKALTTGGESSDDQEYVYINQYSNLVYVGDDEEHSLFLRVYDNLNGIQNDRWVVIYMD